jgi:hypothetical protein
MKGNRVRYNATCNKDGGVEQGEVYALPGAHYAEEYHTGLNVILAFLPHTHPPN